MRRLGVIALLVGALAGCGGGAEPSDPSSPASDPPATTQEQEPDPLDY